MFKFNDFLLYKSRPNKCVILINRMYDVARVGYLFRCCVLIIGSLDDPVVYHNWKQYQEQIIIFTDHQWIEKWKISRSRNTGILADNGTLTDHLRCIVPGVTNYIEIETGSGNYICVLKIDTYIDI